EGTTFVALLRVIVEPVGARSGTFSHAELATSDARQTTTRRWRVGRVTMDSNNMLIPKRLQGQARIRPKEAGYAMAALLVALSVMAVLMSVAMPVWKQVARREKEEELIFRGQQ